MNEPVAFPFATDHTCLPLLFAGQSQKEFFVNHAFAVLDALHARAVAASRSNPPTEPGEGDCFRILPSASDDWTGKADHLAIRIGEAWHFIAPRTGMTVFDAEARCILVYRESWVQAQAPAEPAGGTVIDSEARAAINALMDQLKGLGLLA